MAHLALLQLVGGIWENVFLVYDSAVCVASGW